MMPTATIDGIETRYEILGDGPALLMFAPGGFNAVVENWRSLGVYRQLGLLDRLPEQLRCVAFDRREAGGSSGRVQRLGWDDYVRQGLGLLDHLSIERAHVIGGCIGCSIAARLAVRAPDRVERLVLYSPAGGARYRIGQQERFARHLAYVAEHGTAGVVELARSHDEGFSKDPRVGPWAPVIRREQDFAERYANLDDAVYRTMVAGIGRTMFDRDSVPGVEAEDLLPLQVPALIVPGQDSSHTPSAAHFLAECLPQSELWDVPVEEQTEESAPQRILDFLVGGDGR